MVKRHIRHISRWMVIGFELMGLLAVSVFAAWLFLIIRLSQGPMNADFLTKAIEAGLNGQQEGFEFNVGSTLLTWGGSNQPFEFQINNVRVNRADKTPVLSIKKIGVQLAKRYLVFGKIVPRVIKIYSPALRVIRGEDGNFLLNISNAAEEAGETQKTEGEGEQGGAGNQADFMKNLITRLNDTGMLSLIAGLEQVSITNAALLYDDKILNVSWLSRKYDITFTRGRGGLLVDSTVNVELDQAHTAQLHGSFYYNWQTHVPNGIIYLTDFNPARLAQQSTLLKDFSGIDLPLKGSISFVMDQDFHLGYGRFALASDAGTFNAEGFYQKPAAVKSLFMQGRFNAATKEAVLDQCRLDLDGAKLEASGEIRKQDEGRMIRLKAQLENMPLDRVHSYWPEKLAPSPRAWVTGHLSAGTATKATVNLALLAPQGDFNKLQLHNVGGQIDFNGIKVDYFPPLMPATQVSGKAVYNQKTFNIDVIGGTLDDMQIGRSKVDISDMDIQDADTNAKIDIDAVVNGPLQTALKVIDSKPLQYPQKLGIQAAEVGGDAAINVSFKFPLYDLLTIEEVKATAQAKLNNVRLKNIVSGFDLTGGPIDLSLIGGVSLTVKGKGLLDQMPLEFNWLKNFSDGADVLSSVEAKLPLTAPALAKFGVPEGLKMAGTLPASVTYTVARDNTAGLLLKGNITPTSFVIPVANYEKKEGIPGTLDLFLHLDSSGKPLQISGLSLETEGALLKGGLEFGADGKSLKKADFSQIKLGNTDIALGASSDSKNGYIVNITGNQFDASSMLADSDRPNSDVEAAKPVTPLTVSMTVGRLVTDKEKYVERVKMFLRRNGWSRIEQMEVNGTAGGKPLYLRYMPTPRGHTLRFEADNAGAALSALGITNGMRGGKMVLSGQPAPKGGARDLQGSIMVTDFSLVNVPVLGRLLNAMSLSGMVDLLNGKGVAFKKMRAGYQWLDKGQPESAKNTRMIRVRNGETSGSSLGLTFEGAIDNWTNILDLDGTIIPVSNLNKILDSIPLVGNILTGGGKGVFAATYTVKGPKDQPTVTVNPLAVLAPGILRKLFFEK